MNYSIQHFINKFEAIPDELWVEDVYYSPIEVPKTLFGLPIPFTSKTLDRRCAQGHCINDIDNFLTNRNLTDYHTSLKKFKELKALYDLTQDPEDGEQITIALVNNGKHEHSYGTTPKERVVNYLYYLLGKEYERTNVFSEDQYARAKED